MPRRQFCFMETQRRGRAIVFIDGSNFYFKLRQLTTGTTTSLLDFDYRGLAKYIVGDLSLEKVIYYVGAVKRRSGLPKGKTEKLYAHQQKLAFKLRQAQIDIVWGILIQHPDASFHEKGVDVRIAVEMIRLARENKYDEAFLLSSDTDFVPAVEEVRQLGKRVTYVGTSQGRSYGLSHTTNHTRLISLEDISPFLDKR